LGSLIAASLLENGVAPAKFARVGVRLGFPELVGSQSFLREFCGIGPNNVKDLVLEMLAGRNSNTTLALNS